MTAKLNRLTKAQIDNAKPSDKPRKLYDGGGLSLLIKPTGAKGWRFKYRYAGKHKEISFGPFPAVTLAAARVKRQEAATQLASDLNPSTVRQDEKAAQKAAEVNSFKLYAREWFDKTHASKSLATKTRNERLLKYLLADLGNKSISKITRPQVKDCILRIEQENGRESAHRALNLAERIFESAATDDLDIKDPCYGVRGKLGEVVVRSRSALTDPEDVAKLLQAIWGYHGMPQSVAALKLLAMCFLRPGELRKLEWSEVDFKNHRIVIPRERRKKKRGKIPKTDFLVPLSTQAIKVLKELRKLELDNKWVFPTARPDRPLSENAFSIALKTMGYSGNVHQPHGFRSTASTLLHELGFNSETIETQLDHGRPGVHGTYDRSHLLAQRTQLMQAWSDHLDTLRTGQSSKVIPIGHKGVA